MKWKENNANVYIGRYVCRVEGATSSKWRNIFTVKKYGREGCLEKYEDYIRSHSTLYEELDELVGKELGCWCHPSPCHGDILKKLTEEKLKKRMEKKSRVLLSIFKKYIY